MKKNIAKHKNTPISGIKLFLIFFLCATAYALAQRLGSVFGIFSKSGWLASSWDDSPSPSQMLCQGAVLGLMQPAKQPVSSLFMSQLLCGNTYPAITAQAIRRPTSKPTPKPTSLPTGVPTQPTSIPSSIPSAAPSSVPTHYMACGLEGFLDITQLHARHGLHFDGVAADDFSGFSIAGIGDVNMDGTSDVIITAPFASENGKTWSGEAYVVFGNRSWTGETELKLDDLDGQRGFVIRGKNTNDQLGYAARYLGDVNGDNIDDFILTAPFSDPNNVDAAGESYVIFGRQSLGSSGSFLLDSLQKNNGVTINGANAGDNSGYAVSGGGDINGDGYHDIVIATYTGKLYVLYGGPTLGKTAVIELSQLDNDTGFEIHSMANGNYPAYAISSDGDLNGDGKADILIGEPFAQENLGKTYVIFGQTHFNSTIHLQTLNGTHGFTITGKNPGDRSGFSVAHLGDINQDGIGDIAIGAYSADVGEAISAGETSILFGSKTIGTEGTLSLATLNGDHGFTIQGDTEYGFSAYHVSKVGDVNHDGIQDIGIGSYHHPSQAQKNGRIYVVYGRETFTEICSLGELDGANGFYLSGPVTSAHTPANIIYAGDINADGLDDFMTSFPGASVYNQSNTGQTYLVFCASDIDTIYPTQQPTFSLAPTSLPSGSPTAEPTQPTAQPTRPTSQPTAQPTGVMACGSHGVFELANLNGFNGFVANGIAEGDRTGWSISGLNDINGDGIDDMIIGAYLSKPNGDMSGTSYVIYGKQDFNNHGILELSTLNGTNGFSIHGVQGSYSGYSVAGIGDINNDGISDFAIGAPEADPDGRAGAGIVYVIFGKQYLNFSANLQLSSLNGTNGFSIYGVMSGDRAGSSISGLKDINGDSIDDFIIGAPTADLHGDDSGAAYVLFGSKFIGNNGTIELSELNGKNGFVIEGASAGDEAGRTVSLAGDINNDGWNDILLGANFAGNNGIYSGSAYLLYGKESIGTDGSISLGTLQASDGLAIHGAHQGDYSGVSISGGLDINGDTIDDLMIGTLRGNSNNTGISYVIFGSQALNNSNVFNVESLNGSNGFIILGESAGDYAGRAVKLIGDVNNDKVSDLSVGAWGADDHGENAGSTYVIYGGTDIGSHGTLDLSLLDGFNGFKINGVNPNDWSGDWLGDAGDLNSDGHHDLIISAWGADPHGSESGAAYVVFCAPNRIAYPTSIPSSQPSNPSASPINPTSNNPSSQPTSPSSIPTGSPSSIPSGTPRATSSST